jgi:hypothetical protein
MLVEKGYFTRRKISQGFRFQNSVVAAIVTATLATAITSQVHRAYAGPAVARLTISARVLVHSHMKVLYQASRVRIMRADIQRGYIDVGSASRLEVRSNDPQGYIITFRVADTTPFRAAYVRGSGTDAYIDGQAPVRRPYVRGSEIIEFGYRLILSDDAEPGTYAWPITIEMPEFHGI